MLQAKRGADWLETLFLPSSHLFYNKHFLHEKPFRNNARLRV